MSVHGPQPVRLLHHLTTVIIYHNGSVGESRSLSDCNTRLQFDLKDKKIHMFTSCTDMHVHTPHVHTPVIQKDSIQLFTVDLNDFLINLLNNLNDSVYVAQKHRLCLP